MHRHIAHFEGRVQGVGFRYTVSNLALQYDVHGYVKNLPDGRVELVMEGPDQQVNHLLDDIRAKMNCFIRRCCVNEAPATGEFPRFCIKR